MRRSSSSLTFRLALVALLLATALSFAEGVDGWRTRLTAYKSAIERGEEGIWSKMLSDIDFGVNLYAVENLPSEEVTKHRDVLLGFALKSGFKPLRTAAARKLSGESGELLYEKSKQAVESGGKEAKNALDALGILGTESARTYITELMTQVAAISPVSQ
ncbi:MAG: hypothetical protein U5N86_14090 [Planctomycetota bacterium]|nr:hypothetical protein [Planctomycetota bacterium]